MSYVHVALHTCKAYRNIAFIGRLCQMCKWKFSSRWSERGESLEPKHNNRRPDQRLWPGSRSRRVDRICLEVRMRIYTTYVRTLHCFTMSVGLYAMKFWRNCVLYVNWQFNHRWYCKRRCESWPSFDDNYDIIDASFNSSCDYSNDIGDVNDQGCFYNDGINGPIGL